MFKVFSVIGRGDAVALLIESEVNRYADEHNLSVVSVHPLTHANGLDEMVRIGVVYAPREGGRVRAQSSTPDERINLSFRKRIVALERELIERALGQTGADREAAARLLEIPLRSLRRKMNYLGIPW